MTVETTPGLNSRLAGENAAQGDINQPWEQGNQEWWDWYVTLAENERDSASSIAELPKLPSIQAPSMDKLKSELSEPYDLSQSQIDFFGREGYIKIKDVLSPTSLLHLRTELVRLLSESISQELDGGVRDRFLSLDMVWLDNELVRQFVLSSRIGKLAADLLRVPSVRLYHDNIMSKEPECGRTPWHYDDHHFPIASDDVITVWIPVQPIPKSMGPLAFAKSIEAYKLVESIPFNKFDTSYDRRVSEAFRQYGIVTDDGPFDLGEISFHHNLSFHTAGANETSRSRIVLSNTFFADGARLVDQPTMVSGDWEKFAPGIKPGDPLATSVNPVCWPPQESRTM